MIFPELPILKTPRLTLRKLGKEDIPDFFRQLAGSESVTRYMLWQKHSSLSQSAASIEKVLQRYASGGFYRWAITRSADDSLIGIIDLLHFDEAQNTCSFAYMLAESFWGQGFGTEALSAVLEFAFSQMQVDCVEADHFSVNGASGAVMRKAGMIHTGVCPGKYSKNGISYDADQYRLTRKEWLSSRS